MSSVYRLSEEDLELIKSILRKENISSERVVIDLNERTIKTDDLFDNSDLLEVAGTLSKERANELLDSIKESRAEWED